MVSLSSKLLAKGGEFSAIPENNNGEIVSGVPGNILESSIDFVI
jgi:hypothetical protein